MDTDKKTSGTPLKSFSIGRFQVGSRAEIELHQNYDLVSGDELTVKNPQGEVVYQGLRGFSPLSEKMHLLRYADGRWVLVSLNKGKERRLSKVNLRYAAGKCLLFDERGKLHYDQESPHYPDINIKG